MTGRIINHSLTTVPLTEQELLGRLLYRDALMLVIDKPAGYTVHKAPGGAIFLDQYFDWLRFGLPRPPALAHRLDRDTTGCLVLGRHRQALHRLGKLFSENRIRKTYWAVVQGVPPQPEGMIDIPIKKIGEGAKWQIITAPDGQSALTHYKLLASDGTKSWLELRPHTGRTHQLRVHCAYMGCPIIGDWLYGNKDAAAMPMHLHAREVEIPLYSKRDATKVITEPPEIFKATIATLPLRACPNAKAF